MKIAVNARLMRKGKMDGIGWFTYNTLLHITRLHPEVEFHFFFDSGVDEAFNFSNNIVSHNLFPPAKHSILNIAWFEWSVKRKLQAIQPDLFLSPDGILCLGWEGKQYGVVHDINFFHIPEDLKWSNRKYYNYFFPRFVRKAVRMATVSEYSKQDIVRTYGVPENKIDVVYCGINSFYKPTPDAVKKATKEKFTNGHDYFLFVGSLHPRKNIIRLMQAFEQFKAATGSTIKLVLAGKEMYKTSEMHDCKMELAHGQDILFTGRMEDEDLSNLYAAAFCLTFVPYFEGFGIPPIEAMQCDVPVIASNVTSIPEVTGDAALLVDPYSIKEISTAMMKMVSNPSLRESFIEKGRKRKDHFSWEKTSHLLWESIAKEL